MSKLTFISNRFVVPGIKAGGLRLAFDTEADALLDSATVVHCIVIADLDSDRIDEYVPEQITAALEHLARADYLSGHNIAGYDLPLLRRLHGWQPKTDCSIVDTLITGRLILPNVADLDDQAAAMGDPPLGKLRGRYSLEAFGKRLGIPKTGTDITDWSHWTREMQERCVGDVVICKALWRFLQPDGYSSQAIDLEHRVAAICDGITVAGVPFDIAAAERLRQQWTTRLSELETQLAQQFPGVKLSSRVQIGALLEAKGWVPERRTEKTQQPKIDDELLETIPALYPEFGGLAEHFTLGRRLAQLANGKKAWCKAVADDGRIHGGILHIGTPHSRAKHLEPNLAQVPNPKKGTPFGAECRALFQARDDWVFVTTDQAGLQDRGFAHYLSGFDGGAYTKTFVDGAGIDTHWQSATALSLVPADTARNKESKVHTAIREGAKRFRYAFLYGAGAARAGHIICDIARAVHQIDADNDLQGRFFGGSTHPNEAALKRVGKQALNKFEAATPGLRRLRERLQVHARKHGWLPGLDGRRVPVRALHSALNFIVTSSEAIICKRWLMRVHEELSTKFRYGWDGDVVIVLWVHDEIACCCRSEIAAQVGEIMVRHAKEAGEFYNIRVPLDAEYKIGRSWAGEGVTATITKSKDGSPSMHEATLAAIALTPPVPVVCAPALATWTPDPDDEYATALECTDLPPRPLFDLDEVNDRLKSWGVEPISTRIGAPEITHHGPAQTVEFVASATLDKEFPPLPSESDDPPPRVNGHDTDYFSRNREHGRPTERYVYCNEQGETHQRKIRTSTKNFWQEIWEDGRWTKGAPKVKYLYGIRELLAAPAHEPIWITEGEKDANTLAALKLVAVTNPGGAGKWNSDFTPEQIERWFKGRYTVYLLEDNDAPGRKHVEIIGRALHHLVTDIRVVSFRELPEKGDVSDWLGEPGHTKVELIARATASPKYQQPALQSIYAADVTMTAVDWLWLNRFALGKLGIIAGLPDEGKGLLISYIAAQVTNGGAWPCNEGIAHRGKVILFTAEDDPSDTVVPRLAAAGADLTCIVIISMVREAGKDRMFSLQTDLEMLRRKIDEVGDVVLVLIDPISAYLGVGKIDSYRTTDVRAVLGPVVSLATELKLAVIGIMHFNKKLDITNALLRISDSLAYGATARHVYGVINDADNKRKLMVRAKNNLAVNTAEQTTLAFYFGTREVGTDPNNEKTIVAPYLIWETQYVDVTATEAMQAASESKAPTDRQDTKQFVLDILANGPVKITEIEETATANGISIRTLKRAKRELKNVVARAVKDGKGAVDHWVWELLPEE